MSDASVSVIVPVRDGARYLPASLPPLLASLPPGTECIVSDDGSTDGSGDVARALGARVVRGDRPSGAAATRNRGARETTGAILVFVDADVRVHGETLGRLLAAFEDPSIDAAFGSYDDAPTGSWVSRYKNLAHHFVHQRSSAEASTFWTGCGAVRRPVFSALGGFDPAVHGIEDVELGYRLKEGGHRVRLVHAAQVRHLKEWTLGTWLVSDVRDRALPWARLVRQGRGLPRDLNFRWTDRAATALVGAAGAALVGALWAPWLLSAAVVALGLAAAADAPFVAFCGRRFGWCFAAAATLLQLGHRGAGLAGFAAGWLVR